ncbi:MAG: substrate-binding domain-containing protein [Woeseiaceae bacterium]
MKRPLTAALTAVLLFAACDSSDDGPPPAAVVVYAAEDQETRLAEAFAAFTADTRIPVMLKVGDGGSNLRAVVENIGVPAADVLVTTGVMDVWRAADEGALRPLTATHFDDVPAILRDPDRTWVAIGIRHAVIAASADADVEAVDDYADLATAELRGKVCLSSSALTINRALIAMLIEDIGLKPAERMVRAWVKNLAASPYATEQQLIQALRSGPCQFAILSSSLDLDGLHAIRPTPLYMDIDAIAVARHATQPESAQSLVQWLLASSALADDGSSNAKNVGLAGWRDEDVRLLAERAGYR